MNGQERFAQDFAELVPVSSQPVLIVRRRTCGCRIGAVHRLNGGRLAMAGQRRNLVETGGRRLVELVPFLVADLDAPEIPESFGCQHSSGEVLDLAAIAAAARSVTRRRTPYFV